MSPAVINPLTAGELYDLACQTVQPNDQTSFPACTRCKAFNCKAWEPVSATADRAALKRVGTLRAEGDDEPTFAEFHPNGTRNGSVDAPIAPGWFPYNRCELWQCVGCNKLFLRYNEFGGYYNDERIRELQAHLIHRA